MDRFLSIEAFVRVAQTQSFSEAARRLKMPISTVSRRIAELEDKLGVRLLERSTRSLRLTELGAEVLEHAVRSAEHCEAVVSIVSNRLSDVSGTLRLSAPPSISDTLLTPVVTAFQASYPNVRIQILVTDRFVDHILEGVDLVFRRGALVGAIYSLKPKTHSSYSRRTSWTILGVRQPAGRSRRARSDVVNQHHRDIPSFNRPA